MTVQLHCSYIVTMQSSTVYTTYGYVAILRTVSIQQSNELFKRCRSVLLYAYTICLQFSINHTCMKRVRWARNQPLPVRIAVLWVCRLLLSVQVIMAQTNTKKTLNVKLLSISTIKWPQFNEACLSEEPATILPSVHVTTDHVSSNVVTQPRPRYSIKNKSPDRVTVAGCKFTNIDR